MLHAFEHLPLFFTEILKVIILLLELEAQIKQHSTRKAKIAVWTPGLLELAKF
jgi:hypothetical protein